VVSDVLVFVKNDEQFIDGQVEVFQLAQFESAFVVVHNCDDSGVLVALREDV